VETEDQPTKYGGRPLPEDPVRQEDDEISGHTMGGDCGEMPTRYPIAKYRVIDSQPEQEKGAVIIAQKGGGNRRPYVGGKIAWDGMPGTHGRIPDNLATVIVHELKAKGSDVGEKSQNANGCRPQMGQRRAVVGRA